MNVRIPSLLFLTVLTIAACGDKRPASTPSSPPAAKGTDDSTDGDAGAEGAEEDTVPPPDSPEYAPLD